MAKYKNQWSILIDRPKKFDGNFTNLGRKETADVCSVLNGNALKLWLYLMFQKPGIEWDVSPTAIENEGWLPKKSYYSARDELIEKGFMDRHAVRMFPKNSTTKNEDNVISISRKYTTENEDRNNINEYNNNIDNNFVITSDDKVEIEYQEMKSSTIDSNLRYKQWRKDVTADGLWITPTNYTVKVIFDN